MWYYCVHSWGLYDLRRLTMVSSDPLRTHNNKFLLSVFDRIWTIGCVINHWYCFIAFMKSFESRCHKYYLARKMSCWQKLCYLGTISLFNLSYFSVTGNFCTHVIYLSNQFHSQYSQIGLLALYLICLILFLRSTLLY